MQHHAKTLSAKVFGRSALIKRDDLISSCIGKLSGNKVRKFKSLENSLSIGSNVLSYGGFQSNALLALSKITVAKASRLHYFTNYIPSQLKSHPIGNYKHSLEMHAKIVEVGDQADFRSIMQWSEAGADEAQIPAVVSNYKSLLEDSSAVWVRQGGAEPSAAEGMSELGVEIEELIRTSGLSGPWKVVIASGTGTTAYFLARHFHSSSNAAQLKNDPPHPFATPPLQPKQSNIAAEVATSSSSRMRLDVEVLAVPCVGSKAHLEVQMQQLHTLCGGGNYHGPTVLSTDCAPRRVFAKPCAEHLAIWRALREETGIEFDLIYAPRTFEIMLSHCQDQGGSNAGEFGSLKDWMPGVNILYYHCGGVEGNESQLLRYGKMKS